MLRIAWPSARLARAGLLAIGGLLTGCSAVHGILDLPPPQAVMAMNTSRTVPVIALPTCPVIDAPLGTVMDHRTIPRICWASA